MHRVRSLWSPSRALIAAGLIAGLMAAPLAQLTAQTKAGKVSKTGKAPTTTKGAPPAKAAASSKNAPLEKKGALPTVSKSDAKPVKLAKVDPQTAERTRLAAAKID